MKKKIILIILLILVIILALLITIDFNVFDKRKNNISNTEGSTTNNSIGDSIINNEEEFYFYGKVIESGSTYILVEPNEDEEIRPSVDKISINLGESNDMIYKVGTIVKVTYNGIILKSYPAQLVSPVKIEVKSVD